MQTHREIDVLPVIQEARSRKRGYPEHGFRIPCETIAFGRDAEHVGVELAVHILIMDNGNRIRSSRNVFKVATCLRLPYFYHHDIRCRAQKLFGKAGR